MCCVACAGVVRHNDKYNRNPNSDRNPELNPDTNPEIVTLTHTLSVTLILACKITYRVIVKETVIARARACERADAFVCACKICEGSGSGLG